MENHSKRRRLENNQVQLEHHPPFEFLSNGILDSTIPSIHVLNDDCLDVMFSCLRIAELLRIVTVCKRWYNAVLYKLCRVETFDSRKELGKWRPLTTFTSFEQRLDKFLTRQKFDLMFLSHNKGNVKRLDIVVHPVQYANHVETMLRRSPNLQKLTISILPDMMKNRTIDIHYSELISSILAEYLPKSVRSINLSHSPRKNLNWDAITKDLPSLEAISAKFNNCSFDFFKNNLGNNKMKILILDVHGPSFKAENMEFILKNYCSTLEYLDTGHCNLEAFSFNLANLEPLTRMKVFRHIKIGGHDIETVERDMAGIAQLLKLLPNLEELVLGGAVHFPYNEDEHRIRRERIVNNFATYIPKTIRKLILKLPPQIRCRSNWDIITKDLPNLVEINASSDGTFEFLKNNLSKNKMKSILIENAYNLKSESLEFILRNYCSTLEYLNISRCPPSAFEFCWTNLKPLRRMKSFGAIGIGLPLSRYLPLLKLMPNLECLSLINIRRLDESERKAFLDTVTMVCPHIKWRRCHII